MGVWSPASCTFDWLKKVFPDHYDFTYVSAHPAVNSKGISVRGYKATKHFRHIVDVWDYGWDGNLRTVPPLSVNEAVLNNLADRMLVHYVQPHGPYIGATKLPLPKSPGRAPEEFIVEKVKEGEISLEKFRRAYRDNLRFCLEYVKRLIYRLPHEHIIITSDYGELLGEYGLFLHPPKLCTSILRKVPWLKIQN
ncbi:MAG: hypothetical protein ACTSYT_04350 [Candidatus Asgardarchaeia archaeon]